MYFGLGSSHADFAHRTTNTVYDEVLIVVVSDADFLGAGVLDGG